MNVSEKNLVSLAQSRSFLFVIIAFVLGTIVSGLLELASSAWFPWILAGFTNILLVIAFSALVVSNANREAKKLRKLGQYYHRAVHSVRNFLVEEHTLGQLKVNRQDCCEVVCRNLAQAFTLLLDHKVEVVVELFDSLDGDTISHFAGSEPSDDKENTHSFRLTKNTALENAIAIDTDRVFSHFYSADIDDEEGYVDLRTGQNVRRSYNSTIVVPIRSRWTHHDRVMDLGFLRLETEVKQRLNSEYHIDIAVGFADLLFILLWQSRIPSLSEPVLD